MQSWFGRNWKWLLGLGCVLPALCCGGSGALVAFSVWNTIKTSPVYADVMVKVTTSPKVAAALGEPVALDGFPQGNITGSSEKSTADLSVGVRGPKGKGRVYVHAVQTGTAIVYENFELETAEGAHVNLLEEVVAPPPPAQTPPTGPPEDGAAPAGQAPPTAGQENTR